MGYTTEFEGTFKLDKTLTLAQFCYLQAFSGTRRMKRDALKAGSLADPKRQAVGLPIGEFGEYFVGSEDDFGQTKDASILDYNNPPPSQPGLWCKWEPTRDGNGIKWSNAEKFYYYVEWLTYIVTHFLTPWGLTISGTVTWQGEDPSDVGKIIVETNKITVKKGRVVFD